MNFNFPSSTSIKLIFHDHRSDAMTDHFLIQGIVTYTGKYKETETIEIALSSHTCIQISCKAQIVFKTRL